MAYGVKYFANHYTVLPGTVETVSGPGKIWFRIEILKKDYAGAQTELIGGSDMCQLEYDEIDPRKILETPVQSASLTFSFKVITEAHFAILEEIFEADEDEFLMQILVQTGRLWVGKVLPDLLEWPEVQRPYSATVVAKDFSYLKGKDYPLRTTFYGDSCQTPIEFLKEVLGNLGFELSIFTYTNWTHDDLDPEDDYLNQILKSTYHLRDYPDKPITMYQALEEFLRGEGLILRQSGNAWRVFQLPHLAKDALVSRGLYTTMGTHTMTPDVNLDDPVDNQLRIFLPTANNKMYSGIKKVTQQYDHQTTVGVMTFDEYILQGDPYNISDPTIPTPDPISNTMELKVDGQQYLKLSGKVSIVSSFTSVEGVGKARMQLRVGQYYWSGFQWLQEASSAVHIPVSGPLSGMTGAVEITTNAIPTDLSEEIVEVIFIGSGGITNLQGQNRPLRGLTWSDWELQVINGNVQADNDSITFEAEQDEDLSYSTTLEKKIFGTGPTPHSVSAIRFGSNQSVLSENFGLRGESVTGQSTEELFLQEFIRMQSGARRRISGELWGHFDPGSVLGYGGKRYFFLGGILSARLSTWRANFIELKYEEPDITISKFYNEGKNNPPAGEGGNVVNPGGGGDLDVEEPDVIFHENCVVISTVTDTVPLGVIPIGTPFVWWEGIPQFNGINYNVVGSNLVFEFTLQPAEVVCYQFVEIGDITTYEDCIEIDEVTDTITLPAEPNPNSLAIYVNNMPQFEGDNYTIIDDDVVFAFNLEVGDVVCFRFMVGDVDFESDCITIDTAGLQSLNIPFLALPDTIRVLVNNFPQFEGIHYSLIDTVIHFSFTLDIGDKVCFQFVKNIPLISSLQDLQSVSEQGPTTTIELDMPSLRLNQIFGSIKNQSGNIIFQAADPDGSTLFYNQISQLGIESDQVRIFNKLLVQGQVRLLNYLAPSEETRLLQVDEQGFVSTAVSLINPTLDSVTDTDPVTPNEIYVGGVVLDGWLEFENQTDEILNFDDNAIIGQTADGGVKLIHDGVDTLVETRDNGALFLSSVTGGTPTHMLLTDAGGILRKMSAKTAHRFPKFTADGLLLEDSILVQGTDAQLYQFNSGNNARLVMNVLSGFNQIISQENSINNGKMLIISTKDAAAATLTLASDGKVTIHERSGVTPNKMAIFSSEGVLGEDDLPTDFVSKANGGDFLDTIGVDKASQPIFNLKVSNTVASSLSATMSSGWGRVVLANNQVDNNRAVGIVMSPSFDPGVTGGGIFLGGVGGIATTEPSETSDGSVITNSSFWKMGAAAVSGDAAANRKIRVSIDGTLYDLLAVTV